MASQKQSSARHTSFLDLPREIRDEIYMAYFEKLLQENRCLITRPSEFNIYTRILLTNQQIYHETKSLFAKIYLPTLYFVFEDIPSLQFFHRTIGRKNPAFKGYIRLNTQLNDDVSYHIRRLLSFLAKQAGFEDDVDEFTSMLKEVAGGGIERDEDSDSPSGDAFLVTGEDWVVEVRHEYHLDMVAYYESLQLDGDIGRLEWLSEV